MINEDTMHKCKGFGVSTRWNYLKDVKPDFVCIQQTTLIKIRMVKEYGETWIQMVT